MNQASLAVRKSGRGLAKYVEPSRCNLIDVDATAVNVAHVKAFAILRRIGVAVEIGEAAIGRLLMFVLDDGAELPGERRIRPALALVIARFGQVPQMIDHTGTDKGAAFLVPGDAPRIAGALREQLKFARVRVDAKQAQVKLKSLPFCLTWLELNTPLRP